MLHINVIVGSFVRNNAEFVTLLTVIIKVMRNQHILIFNILLIANIWGTSIETRQIKKFFKIEFLRLTNIKTCKDMFYLIMNFDHSILIDRLIRTEIVNVYVTRRFPVKA